ncbi:MAG: glycosyltransferase [Pseudomonadota bacterium]
MEEFVLRPSWLTLIGILCFKIGLFPIWAWAWLKVMGRHTIPLNELAVSSEVVIADFPFVSPIFELANHAHKVLNTHNIEANLATGRFSKKAVAYLENLACKAADVVAACSPSDADYFSTHYLSHSLVIPNCISPKPFLKDPNIRDEFRKKLNFGDKKVCLFSASAYGPNREGYEFLRKFSEKYTAFMLENKIIFLIIGSVAPKTDATEVLMVTGRVDTVAPYFQAADIALNPIFRGEGTSIKVAEYIAASLPLLTTEVGKRGYHLQDGESAFVFSKDTFKDQLDKILRVADTAPLTDRAREANLASFQVKEALKPLSLWIHNHVP